MRDANPTVAHHGHMAHKERDRDALIAELESTATGCLGSDRLLAEAAQAAARLRAGADEVQVGHTVNDDQSGQR